VDEAINSAMRSRSASASAAHASWRPSWPHWPIRHPP